MAIQSHIESLKSRHQELETQLSELIVRSGSATELINDLKRRKLQLKDRIEDLQTRQALN
jgi:hypothetical protein